uniref:Uncharacterized protein n=1 Tax=Ditylenchus dipsaci TaxID=166011 RepID=A0A915EHI1_9BILA
MLMKIGIGQRAIEEEEAEAIAETVPDEYSQMKISGEENECQLSLSETTPVEKRKRHNYDAATKLEAIECAQEAKSARSRKYNIKATAKKFRVDRKQVREWITREQNVRQQVSTPGASKRKKLDGTGRKVLNPELDVQIAEWIRKQRTNKHPVSHRIILNRAEEVFRAMKLKVTVLTTGHEKMRVTVCLTATADRKKLLPYVLVNR